MKRCAQILATLLVLTPVTAYAETAGHLLISEVHYDPSDETAEYIEIFNPTDTEIVLNDGTTSYFLSDDQTIYWEVVNGNVTNGLASDWLLQFPVDAVIPAHGIVVVTGDSAAFVTEYYGTGGLQAFLEQPGAPQLFEFQTDADTVPDMINRGSSTAMSLTNTGEDVILFVWDGVSDLVADVDHVTWADTNELVDKTGVSIDGPDVDTDESTYLADAGTATAASDPGAGISIQRTSAVEASEVATGGNGLAGHDETTEDWSASFATGAPTPGRFLLVLDGDLADLAAVGAPLAVSGADGAGDGAVADFGTDGTITELYAVPIDEDFDGRADVLWVGVRGEFFTTNGTINGTFVAIDADPGAATGTVDMLTDGTDLSDTTGLLDTDITVAGVTLDAALEANGIGIDAVAGVTEDACPSTDVCGLRGFGSGGVAGATSDFAWLDDLADLEIGAVNAALPAAAGAGYAAPEGLEFRIDLTDLGSPGVVALAAYSSGDGANDPSPNTLPENASNAFDSAQTLEAVVYVYIDTDSCLTVDDCAECYACTTYHCAMESDDTECSDGDLCTETDICTGGVCAGSAKDCSGLDDQCNTGACNAGTGECQALPVEDDTECNDSDLCTETDVCTAGACAGTDKDCSAVEDQCNTSACNAGTGACEAVAVEDDTDCNDSDLCTGSDVCTGGVCAGTATDCTELEDQCNTGACTAATGVCEAVPIDDDTDCNDENPCTESDVCTSGVCGGITRDCSGLDDQCNTGTCNTGNGECEKQPVADGTMCNDGDSCTGKDACHAGTCAGEPIVGCDRPIDDGGCGCRASGKASSRLPGSLVLLLLGLALLFRRRRRA